MSQDRYVPQPVAVLLRYSQQILAVASDRVVAQGTDPAAATAWALYEVVHDDPEFSRVRAFLAGELANEYPQANAHEAWAIMVVKVRGLADAKARLREDVHGTSNSAGAPPRPRSSSPAPSPRPAPPPSPQRWMTPAQSPRSQPPLHAPRPAQPPPNPASKSPIGKALGVGVVAGWIIFAITQSDAAFWITVAVVSFVVFATLIQR